MNSKNNEGVEKTFQVDDVKPSFTLDTVNEVEEEPVAKQTGSSDKLEVIVNCFSAMTKQNQVFSGHRLYSKIHSISVTLFSLNCNITDADYDTLKNFNIYIYNLSLVSDLFFSSLE